jgi:hypothetical protein
MLRCSSLVFEIDEGLEVEDQARPLPHCHCRSEPKLHCLPANWCQPLLTATVGKQATATPTTCPGWVNGQTWLTWRKLQSFIISTFELKDYVLLNLFSSWPRLPFSCVLGIAFQALC